MATEQPTCVFRHKAATDSNGSRPPVPIEPGHPGEAVLKLSMLAIESRTRPLCGHARGGPMPAERAPMRKVREVLRLRYVLGVSERQIAITTGLSRSTVGEYLRRAAVIGITRPVPEGLDDADLGRPRE